LIKPNVLLLPHDKEHWNNYQRVKTGHRQNFFSNVANKTLTLPVPEDVIPPSNILLNTNKHFVTGQLRELQESPQTSTTTFLEKLMQQQNNTMFHTVDLTADETSLRHSFHQKALLDTATDGGHDHSTGILTYGWVISVNECIIAKGRGLMEANPHMAELFRAEAYVLA
jgi:hypothetical protein